MKSFFRLVLAGAGLAGGGAGLGAHCHAPGHPWPRSRRPGPGGKESGRGPHDRRTKRTGTERRTPVLQPHCPGRKNSLPASARRKPGAARLAGSRGRKPGPAARRDSQCASDRASASPTSTSGAAVWTSARSHKCDCRMLPRARSWRRLRLRTPAASPLRKSVCWLPRLLSHKPWSCPTLSDSRWAPSPRPLQDAGLRVGSVTPAPLPEGSPRRPRRQFPSPASMIVSQNPAAGEKVMRGRRGEL